MGRYYSGDIEGKFAFGVQSSNAADRFGVAGQPPDFLEYNYTEADMPHLKDELKIIEDSFGEHKTAIMVYHDLDGSDENKQTLTIEEFLKKSELPEMSTAKWNDYYDYKIGRKILDHVNMHDTCIFQAEL
jgi:hypothetical protein